MDLNSSSPTLPRSGSMRNGCLSRRPTLVLRTDALECSSWPTPAATVICDGVSEEVFEARRQENLAKGINGNGMGTPLTIAAQTWPTPDTNRSSYSNGHNGFANLRETATLWGTPEANERANRGARRSNNPISTGGGQSHLADDVELWATPAATDDRRGTTGYSPQQIARGARVLPHDVSLWATPMAADDGNKATPQSKIGLIPQAVNWPTPSARDTKSGDASDETMDRNARPLNEVACRFSPQVPQTADGLTSSSKRHTSRRRLNPAFVCWLMGAPWWWTRAERINFAAEEMESYRCRLLSHLLNLCGGSNHGVDGTRQANVSSQPLGIRD
jgi:hypothetical protein